MRGTFKSELDVTPLPDGKTWRLNRDLVWVWADGRREVCPAGMVTDFASVPDLSFFAGLLAAIASVFGWLWLLWPALVVCVLAKRIDDDSRTDAPACHHDLDYGRAVKPRYVADWHLVVRMRANRVGWWKCGLYWINLRLFGWLCYGRK